MADVQVQEEGLHSGKIGYFFECPMCGEKYPFATVTEQGLVFLPELKSIREQIKDCKGNTMRAERLNKKYEKLLKLYQNEVGGPYKLSEVLENE